MPVANTMHGARAILKIDGKKVGIFNSASWGMQIDMQPIFILGRFSPAEIVPTGQEAVSVTATGFRIYGRSPHVVAGLSTLQDLLTDPGLTSLTIEDRQNGANIMLVEGVRVAGYSTSVNARGVQEITVNFIGTKVSDESVTNTEAGVDIMDLG